MDHATDSGLPHHIQNQLIYAAMRGTLNQNGSTTPQEGQSGLQDIDGQLMQLLGQQYPAIPVPSPVSLPSGAQLDEDDDSSGDDEGSDFGMTDESFEDQAYEPTTARERRDASRPHRPRKSSVHSINSVSTSASFDESSMGPNAMASEYTVTTDDPDVSDSTERRHRTLLTLFFQTIYFENGPRSALIASVSMVCLTARSGPPAEGHWVAHSSFHFPPANTPTAAADLPDVQTVYAMSRFT